jgi:hypothetical protein
MRKRLLLVVLLVMSCGSSQVALVQTRALAQTVPPAQTIVFLKCTFFNGRVERLKIDPRTKSAAILEGGTFALEVSESFYTLTTVYDFGASGGGIVDIETRIDRRSELLTTKIFGENKGNFAQYPLSGMCEQDRPWPGTIF